MNDIAISVIGGVASVTAAWISANALRATRQVSRQVKPVSNGFAADVQTKLAALDAHLADLHEDLREVRKTMTKHLASHGE